MSKYFKKEDIGKLIESKSGARAYLRSTIDFNRSKGVASMTPNGGSRFKVNADYWEILEEKENKKKKVTSVYMVMAFPNNGEIPPFKEDSGLTPTLPEPIEMYATEKEALNEAKAIANTYKKRVYVLKTIIAVEPVDRHVVTRLN